MTEQTTALTLPSEEQFTSDIHAINRFQAIVRANMREGQDYGVIPGTKKPTLLKPGAEKIAKLLGLADRYDILDKTEDWDKGFFRYLIKCQLIHIASGNLVSEGLGECNSMESKYRWRWIFPSELPEGIDKNSLPKKIVNTRNGKTPMYRVDNDDIYSQVNTVVKMAKKRALVDAALSAGRLSEVFTQDIEDIKVAEPTPQPKAGAKTRSKSEAKGEQPTEDKPEESSTDSTESETPEFANAGEFLTACAKSPLHKTRSEVLEALSINNISEIKNFNKAYQDLLG